MKKGVLFFAAGAVVLSSCVSNPEGKKAETTDGVEVSGEVKGTELAVNTAESKVEWLGKKVSGQHNGDVAIKSGSLLVNEGKLSGGNFVIDLTTINTTDMEGEYKDKLDGHLKNEDFFDVPNHPEATFEITEVKEGTETGVVVVSGNLTIRGVTKNITFDANVSEVSETAARISADFNIEREDWGITYSGQADDLISKQINFKINVVAGA